MGSTAVLDADQHYYEPRDAFTRHNDDPEAGMVEVVRDGSREEIQIGGVRHEYPPTFDKVAPPGSLLELLESATGRGDRNPLLEAIRPEYQQRDARLATLERQGVAAALLLPTIGVTVEHPMRDNPRRTYASLRAFNRWMDDDWGFDRDGRMFAVPMLSLIDVDEAIGELERVIDAGARLVHLLAGPAHRASPADPKYDRFWAIVNEARVPVVFHGADSGYAGLIGERWGEPYPVRVHHLSPWARAFCFMDAPIMHTLGALVLAGLFERFPSVRVVSLEHGSGWVGYLLHRLDKTQRELTSRAPWPRGPLSDKASDIFRDHVWVSPFPEENVADLLRHIPPSRVLFGSDWPHPEGLAEPMQFLDRLPPLAPKEAEMIMGANLRGLLTQ